MRAKFILALFVPCFTIAFALTNAASASAGPGHPTTWAGELTAATTPWTAPVKQITAHRTRLRYPARAGASPKTTRRSPASHPHHEADTAARPAKRTVVRPLFVGASLPRPSATTGGPTSPPFTECPGLGLDGSCGSLLVITNSATVVKSDASQGPYDGSDDTLVGVLNQSTHAVASINLASDTDLFGFDGDGLCTEPDAPAGCPFGPTGYEGPGTSFSNINGSQSGGTVVFTGSLAPGASAYFSLEEALSASQIFAGGPSSAEQGGAANPSELISTCFVADPVNCATGRLIEQATDVAVPGRGPALALSRTYDSGAAAVDTSLGHGWRDDYDMALSVGADGTATVTQENGSQVSFASDGGGGFIAAPRVRATLVSDGNGGYGFTRKADNRRFDFDAGGQLVDEVDRNGYATALTYSAGHLETVTDPAGRTLEFSYTGSHISSVTDPQGDVHRYGYDASHRLTTNTTADGGVTTNTYDADNRLIEQVGATGLTQRFAYSGDAASASGGATTITDGHGSVSVESYVDLELQSVEHASGTPSAARTSYVYDPATLGRTRITDPSGNVTSNAFDTDGNLVSTTDPMGDTTSYAYNGFDEMTQRTTPGGASTDFDYDSTGNLTTVTDPLGGQTQYSYGAGTNAADVSSVTDANGHATLFTYDGFGNRVSRTTTPRAGVTETLEQVFDGDGELVCQASPDAVQDGCTAPRSERPEWPGRTPAPTTEPEDCCRRSTRTATPRSTSTTPTVTRWS